MNKQELGEKLAQKGKLNKSTANELIDHIFEIMTDALIGGDEIKVSGFGNFSVKDRKKRQGINPATKQPITIPATKTVGFKISKILKEKVVSGNK